jgi:hypothetical protein
MSQEVENARYVGDGCMLEWLLDVCESDPLIIPERTDYTQHAMFLLLRTSPDANTASLFRFRENQQFEHLIQFCGPRRLWFCHVPIVVADVMTETII